MWELLREIFPVLIHTSESCSRQCWARLKPGVKSLISVSHRGGTDPNIWAIFCSFSQIICRELDKKWNSWNLEWCSCEMLLPPVEDLLATTLDQSLHNTTDITDLLKAWSQSVHRKDMGWWLRVMQPALWKGHRSSAEQVQISGNTLSFLYSFLLVYPCLSQAPGSHFSQPSGRWVKYERPKLFKIF